MSLPSQYARTSNAGGPARIRPNRNLTPVLLIVAGLVAAVGIVWLLSKSGGAGGSPTTPAVSASNGGAALIEKPKIPEPVQVHQGLASAAPESKLAQPAPSEMGGLRTGMVPAAQASVGPGSGVAPPKAGVGGLGEAGANAPANAGALASDLQDLINAGRAKIASGDAVAARVLLSRALLDSRTPESERSTLRDDLTVINQDLVFSPRVDPQDPFAYAYTIQSGDRLIKINQKEKLAPDWRLIQRVNKMGDAGALRLGGKLKLVRGPFHAVVTKSAYRLDIFMGAADKPSDWVYVRSFQVGLGENNATPIGNFRVRPGSKLVNPPWVNPRTGEKFAADDPKNPIGEHWIGLEGVGETATVSGYGIHGTIDPESIGKQKSMGCVRLRAEDIAQVYELLGEGVSTVKIQP